MGIRVRTLIILMLTPILLCPAVFLSTASAEGPNDGTGQVIAVIDYTGIDSGAPILFGRVIHEVCLNSEPLKTSAFTCPLGATQLEAPGAAADQYIDNQTAPGMTMSHGTAVASVIASTAPGAKIVAIRIPDGLKQALKWVLDNANEYNISTIAISVGAPMTDIFKDCVVEPNFGSISPTSTTLQKLITDLRIANIAIFFSAGNEANQSAITTPACRPGVYSVGASQDGFLAPYSNVSEGLTILAPGTQVITDSKNGRFTTTTSYGTSYATPYMAAIYAITRAAHPDLSPDDIMAAARFTATPTNSRLGTTLQIINPQALYGYLATSPITPNLSATFLNKGVIDSIKSQQEIDVAQSIAQAGSTQNNLASYKLASQLDLLAKTANDLDLTSLISTDALKQRIAAYTAPTIKAPKSNKVALAAAKAQARSQARSLFITLTKKPYRSLVCLSNDSIDVTTTMLGSCPDGYKRFSIKKS